MGDRHPFPAAQLLLVVEGDPAPKPSTDVRGELRDVDGAFLIDAADEFGHLAVLVDAPRPLGGRAGARPPPKR